MVGSEGTLGVVTEVTLRLRPALAGTPRTVVGAFGSLVDAGTAVAAVTRRGLTPSALELLDRACLQAVEEWKHLGLEADAEALLLARVDTPGEGGDAEAAAVVDAFGAAGAAVGGAVRPTTPRRRRCSPPAGSPTRRWSGSGRCSPRTSACPRSAVPEMLAPARARSPRGTRSRSPPSRTPATATCTRCC